MNNKGFLDLGMVLILAWGVIVGTTSVHYMTKDQKAEELCKRQGSVQIGNSLYQCKKTHTLGEAKTEKVFVTKPCPKCKPVAKPCGDDKKIFPMCESLK